MTFARCLMFSIELFLFGSGEILFFDRTCPLNVILLTLKPHLARFIFRPLSFVFLYFTHISVMICLWFTQIRILSLMLFSDFNPVSTFPICFGKQSNEEFTLYVNLLKWDICSCVVKVVMFLLSSCFWYPSHRSILEKTFAPLCLARMFSIWRTTCLS